MFKQTDYLASLDGFPASLRTAKIDLTHRPPLRFARLALGWLMGLSVTITLNAQPTPPWTATARTTDLNRNWYAMASSADGTHLVAAVNGGQIYTSTNSGATWTAQAANGPWCSVASASDGTTLAAVAEGGQIYTSTNSGATWTAQTNAGNIVFYSVAGSADGTKLVARGGPLTESGFVGNLDGTNVNSTFDAGSQEPVASDAALTWTSLPDPLGNYPEVSDPPGATVGMLINSDLYANYGLQYATGVPILPNTTYTLHFDMGFDSSTTGGVSGFSFQLGTLDNAGNFTGLGDPVTNNVLYAGDLESNVVSAATQQVFTALSSVSGDQLAVQWTQTSSLGGGYSEHFGFRNVTLYATGLTAQVHIPALNAYGDTYSGGQLYTSTDGGATWTAHLTDTNRLWRCVGSSADGTRLVAGVYGGQVYTSTNSGAAWTARMTGTNRNWWSVASSADGAKLVAVENPGLIYTSTDSGATWTARMTDADRSWLAVASSADGAKLVAGVYNGLLYTSTDGGATWTAEESDGYWQCLASSADGINLAAGVYGGQVYTSTNSGVTWAAQVTDANSNWWSVASSADGTRLMAAVDGGLLYTSTSSDATWTAETTNAAWCSLASSSDGAALAAVVEGGQIYTSTKSGATWTAPTNASNIGFYSVASSSDGTKLVARGEVLQNPFVGNLDGTNTDSTFLTGSRDYLPADGWIAISANTPSVFGWNGGFGMLIGPNSYDNYEVQYATGVPILPNTIYTLRLGMGFLAFLAGGNCGYSLQLGTLDNMGNFTGLGDPVTNNVPYGGDVYFGSAPTYAQQVFTTGSSVSGDPLAVQWAQTSTLGAPYSDYFGFRDVTLSATPNIPGLIAYGDTYTGGQLYTSTDGGATWTAQLTDTNRLWRCVASSADGTRLVAGVYGGQVYTSKDSGATWTAQTTGANRNWWSVASSADGTKLVAVENPGLIYTSTDSGATWTARMTGTQRNWLSVASSADGAKLAACVYNGQIYTSADSGATWTAQLTDANRAWCAVASSADGTRLVAGVYGGQVYTLTLIEAAPPVLSGLTHEANGTFHFGFTYASGTSFTVLGSTDLSLPVANWTVLGAPVESPPGHYQFTDTTAPGLSRRFYRVRY
ncbi:MAG: hypothetical protein ABSH34_02945 [Verrucomicrobiota bacterium]